MVYADVMATGSARSPADTVLITKLVMTGSSEVNMVVLHYILCYKYLRNNNEITWNDCPGLTNDNVAKREKSLTTKGHFNYT